MKSASFLLSAVALGALHAQTIDTGILGEIRDPTGAAIAAAMVTIMQPTTGLSKTVTTDSGGHYEVRYLVPGNYTVEAKVRDEAAAVTLLDQAVEIGADLFGKRDTTR